MRTHNGFLSPELSLPWRAALTYAAVAVGFALVSLGVTGFRFSSNNVFHIPYVLDLASRPEFADDAFYATLEFFTSVVWPPLRLVANESNLPALFEGVHVFSRILAFAGLVFLLRVNGLSNFLGLATAVAALAVTPWLRGMSLVGIHDMLPDYLTHTGLTWGFVFFALGLLQVGKHPASAAMTGIVFAINAFVGVWLLCISAFVLCFDRASWTARRLAGAAVVFLLFASPALAWIALAMASARQAGEGVDYGSYVEYIRLYFPQHFLIEAASVRKLAGLAWLYIVGLLAARHVAAARFWTLVQVACLLIFLAGIPLPYVWDSRLLINLHLLRSDGVEQAVAIILAALAGVKLIQAADSWPRQLAGVIVLLSIATAQRRGLDLLPIGVALAAALVPGTPRGAGEASPPIVLACLLAVAATGIYQLVQPSSPVPSAIRLVLSMGLLALVVKQRYLGPDQHAATGSMTRGLLMAIVFVALATSAAASLQRTQADRRIEPAARSWQELTSWIRSSDIHGVFLIPLSMQGEDPREWRDWFQLAARRPVWVDWKQGAAAMWWPPFQEQWMQRYSQVSALREPEEFVTYARANDIPNVVIESATGNCPPPSTRVKATAHYVLCRLAPRPKGPWDGR